jgi:hypothetical protein
VVTIGDPHRASPPAVHRIPVDAGNGTVVIADAAADRQTVHVSVAARDGRASPSAQAKPT